MKVYSSESITAEYDASQKLLQLSCGGNMTAGEFHKGYQAALKFARTRHITHWMLDLRRLVACNEEMWMNPLYLMMLGYNRHNYIGIVLSTEKYRKLLKEVGQEGLQSYNYFIRISTFYTRSSARDWLRSKIKRGPGKAR